MELSELKLTVAANIISLRTKAGMTQAELGSRINYSDKTISKWERGEAIPDAYVLTQLGEIFAVNVDYLLSSHDAWEAPEEPGPGKNYRTELILAVAVLGVWTLGLTVFVALWLSGRIMWEVFAVTLPVSFLVCLVLMSVFKHSARLQYVIAALVLSIFVLIYALLPLSHPWQLFLIAVPALVIVFLSCNIKKPSE